MAETLTKEEAIFHAALEIAAADQRSAYLDAACGNQDELRQRMEALLHRYVEAEVAAAEFSKLFDQPAARSGRIPRLL